MEVDCFINLLLSCTFLYKCIVILLVKISYLKCACMFYLIVRSTKPEWICNMCTSNAVYTENDIKTHIKLVHNVSNMFKCPMCVFEHNDDNTIVFEHHFKFNHPSVAVKLTKVFDKVSVFLF